MRGAGLVRVLVAVVALAAATRVPAQDRGAVRTHFQEPVYPENLSKTNKQGNVNLIGRIDPEGRVIELRALAASHPDFVTPAAQAVSAWTFRPATRDGKPLEIFANIAVRFRIDGDARGIISGPILGDLAISPADASGKATAPEGFPLRRGVDKALRAVAVLDVPPNIQTRTVAVGVEAVSPSGKRLPLFQPPVSVPAKATEVKIPVVVPVPADWEEGVWLLRFTADGAFAGAGQFWLATDPAHFQFVVPAPKP